MQAGTTVNSIGINNSNMSSATRVFIIWIITLMALGLSGFIGEKAADARNLSHNMRYGMQALIMSGIVVSAIWWMRTRVDRGAPLNIGVGNFTSALKYAGLGIGFFLVPLLLTLLLSIIFGWADVSLNTTAGFLPNFFIGVLTVFLFEALPEELAFRGYIFSNLNHRLKKWKAALITICLFVLLPVTLAPITRHILGMEIQIGSSNSITASYVITMFVFAAFVQYLRILTGSIWTGIGFHLVFVYINRMVGIEDTNLIQMSNATSETPMQIVLISSMLLVFLSIILYPIISKRKIGWKETLQ